MKKIVHSWPDNRKYFVIAQPYDQESQKPIANGKSVDFELIDVKDKNKKIIAEGVAVYKVDVNSIPAFLAVDYDLDPTVLSYQLQKRYAVLKANPTVSFIVMRKKLN